MGLTTLLRGFKSSVALLDRFPRGLERRDGDGYPPLNGRGRDEPSPFLSGVDELATYVEPSVKRSTPLHEGNPGTGVRLELGGTVPGMSLVVSDSPCPTVRVCGSRFSARQTSEAVAKTRSAAMPGFFALLQLPNALPRMGLLAEELAHVSSCSLLLSTTMTYSCRAGLGSSRASTKRNGISWSCSL